MDLKDLLPMFERGPAWAWMCGQFLSGSPSCPCCGQQIEDGRALRSFRDFRRTFCKGCGRKFSPAAGTPIHGTRWSPEELVRFLVLHLAGQDAATIGRALGKSPEAIRDMRERAKLHGVLAHE